MQTSVIVKGENTRELERLLKDNWHVTHTCPMPSSCSVALRANGSMLASSEQIEIFEPQCLVILEKQSTDGLHPPSRT